MLRTLRSLLTAPGTRSCAGADVHSIGHDGITGLLSVASLRRVIEREKARSDRSGLPFSVARLRADYRTAAGRELFSEVVEFSQHRLRVTDDLGWLSTRELAVVLPLADEAGADVVAREYERRFAGRMSVVAHTYPGDFWLGSDEDKSAPDGQDLESHEDQLISGSSNLMVASSVLGSQTLSAATTRHSSAASAGHEGITTMAADRRTRRPSGGDLPVMAERPLPMMVERPLPVWKRAMDLVCAGTGLLLLSPVFALIALLIRMTSAGPIFFCQQRTGRGGRAFKIYKFRSMVVDADAQKQALRAMSEQDGPAFKMTNDPRITSIGKFLRKTSLDELPQLLNVLRGDMTLVGPRPLPIDETAGCQPWQLERLLVTPGLTCIWQVYGRSRVTFDEWMRMDVRYIRRMSPLLDLKLILLTAFSMVFRKNGM